MAQVYFDKNAKKVNKIITHNLHSNCNALWIKPSNYLINEIEVKGIIDSFLPMNCALWYISGGVVGCSDRIRDHKRAFSSWRRLSKKVFSKEDIYEKHSNEKYYSDICFADCEDVSDITDFFRQVSFGINSGFVFAPKAVNASGLSMVFSHLRNIWLIRNYQKEIYTTTNKVEEFELFLKCLGDTKSVAGIVCEDCDTSKALILLSNECLLLEAIFNKMIANKYSEMDERFIVNWINRGLDLRIFL